jgi:molybdopterin-containing oxidoreductase family iron-sulfur binding subunit
VLLLISVCQCLLLIKQALVHIYNIVTGSSVAVNLEDKFKSEVTKLPAIKAAGKSLVSGIQDKMLSC